jgi:hypothetical protein
MSLDETELTFAEPADAEHRPDVVNFYFPVEVVVVGALRDADRDALEAGIWERLYNAIERTA